MKKKKKLKINVHRPIGTRFVFDEEGNSLPPLAALAEITSGADGAFHFDKEEGNKSLFHLIHLYFCRNYST